MTSVPAAFFDELQPREPAVRLVVGYDGPALATGRMDVRVLAGAMASVAQLVDDATRITYGMDAGIRVEVSGNFRRGSFSYQIIATVIAGLTPEQIRNVLEWLGLISTATGLTVVGVLKWLRGRKVEAKRDGDNVVLTAGNQTNVVNLQVAQLVLNHSVRMGFEGITQPFEQVGIDVLRTSEREGAPTTEISKQERKSFIAPPPLAEALHDGESVAVLQVVSPVFRVGNKWQFAYPGEAPFFAPILDKGFMFKFERREEGFLFGDLVRVRLRTVITRTEAGTLSTSREILEILEKIEPAKQTDLFSPPEA